MGGELESGSPDPGIRTGIDRTELYDVLANRRRQRILSFLEGQNATTVNELAEELASAEFGEYSKQERKRIYVSIYQTHLPRLDSAGLVDFEQKTGEITVGEQHLFQEAVENLEKLSFLSAGRDSVDVSQLYDIMGSERRQFVLQVLDENEGSLHLGDLAERVAARENNEDVDDLSRQERKRVYVALYQVHLSKMQDAGVLRWDKEAGQVSLLGRDERISFLLRGEFESPKTKIKWYVHKLRNR